VTGNHILDTLIQSNEVSDPVLIVDDESSILEMIQEMLANQPYEIFLAESCQEAERKLKENEISIVLTDLLLDDGSGVEVMAAAQKYHPNAKVILMTGKPTIQNAISVIKKGAFDYLVKPFNMENLMATIKRAAYQNHLEEENVRLNEVMSYYAISEAMGSVIEPSKLLKLILDTVVREFNADYAALHLVKANGEIMAEKNVCKHPDLEDHLNEFSQLVAEDVYQKSRPRLLSDKDAYALTGAKSIRSSICQLLIAKGVTIGTLSLTRTNDIHHYTTGNLSTLSLFASKAAISIENSKLYKDLEDAYFDTVEALANAIEARDRYTAGHTNRVWRMTVRAAQMLKWDDSKIKELRMGAILHDVGKIGVPDAILNKQGPLDSNEQAIMKTHPELGVRMIEKVNFLKPAIPYILYHHERWDGNGYPQGLKGEEIPIEGRLLAVADTFDAITSNRPYRKGQSVAKALEEIEKNAGTQFDPQIVELFLDAAKIIDFDIPES
jgi:response regulator RpfG family c-di-GMP phosphodiesterase